jgi:hypothetical protein
MSHPPPPPPYGGGTPFGDGPAGAPPPAAGAPDPAAPGGGKNGFAVAALICGILAPCGLGLLALIFGIIALVQIKNSGQRGRGMAITGIALTGVWAVVGAIVLVVLLAIGASADRDNDGEVSLTSLRPGDCIERLEEGPASTTVPAVPCAEPHEGEVYAIFDLADGDWPGDEAVWEEAESGCVDRLFDYSPTAYEDEQIDIFYVHPTSDTWGTGDREVVCVTYYLDGLRTGSIKGS